MPMLLAAVDFDNLHQVLRAVSYTHLDVYKRQLESSLSFAMAIQKLLVKNEACRLAGLYLFWNMEMCIRDSLS